MLAKLHFVNRMEPGDIVYRLVLKDGRDVREPVELVALYPEDPDKALIKTSTGEICEEKSYMLTGVPYLPGIEEALGDLKDPKDNDPNGPDRPDDPDDPED